MEPVKIVVGIKELKMVAKNAVWIIAQALRYYKKMGLVKIVQLTSRFRKMQQGQGVCQKCALISRKCCRMVHARIVLNSLEVKRKVKFAVPMIVRTLKDFLQTELAEIAHHIIYRIIKMQQNAFH